MRLSRLIIPLMVALLSGGPTEARPLAEGTAPPPGPLAPRQLAFTQLKFGMFIHFGMSTFSGSEWANGYEDPALFNPTRLDCAQWAEAAAAAGMGYAILTVKHTGGWCLWPSAYTRHGVQSFTRFEGGNGDIVGQFVTAFRARGLKVGLYYCFPGDYTGKFGNIAPEGVPDLHGMPPEAGPDYVAFIKLQLAELIARYAPDLIWIDQASRPYTSAAWPALKAYLHELSPNCVVLANNARDLQTSDALSYEWPWDAAHLPNNIHGLPHFVGTLPPPKNTAPAELSDTIQARSRWFWHPDVGTAGLQSVETMADIYRVCRERNCNYLLNVPVNREGRIPDDYVAVLKNLGMQIGQQR